VDYSIESGEGFLIGRVSGVDEVPESGRYVIRFEEYAEVSLKSVWPGNRNPVAYVKMSNLERDHQFAVEDREWQPFPTDLIQEADSTPALTVDQAKRGLAKKLGIDPDCIEIRINA